MSTALSSLRKVALASLGAAGLALVAYLVEHGDVPEWMHRLCGWVWDILTLTSVWALWEIFVPIFCIGALAVLFLHQEAIKIAGLQELVSNLYKELADITDRERELVTRLEGLKTKSNDGSPTNTLGGPLSARQFKLLRLIYKLGHNGAQATSEKLRAVSGMAKGDFLETIDDLKKTDHIIQMISVSGASYLVTPTGRKLVTSYLSNQTAR